MIPIIYQHGYDCNDTVLVYSLEFGSKVTICSVSDNIRDGSAQGGSLIPTLGRSFAKYQELISVA